MHILCIDDEAIILDVLKVSLEASAYGYQVTTCLEASEALRKAAQLQPDLILLDAMMPEMEGQEVLRRLRTNPATASIPVIFLTALLLPSDTAQYEALGAIGVILKPFDVRTLSGKIHRLWSVSHDRNRRLPR